MNTLLRRFKLEEGVEVAYNNIMGPGPVPAVNKLIKTDPVNAMLEDTAWVENGFATYTVDDITALLNREDDNEGDKARSLKVRYARTRCRRLVFAGGVEFLLIFAYAW